MWHRRSSDARRNGVILRGGCAALLLTAMYSWSPAGATPVAPTQLVTSAGRIVYSASCDLWIINADGTGNQQLTTATSCEYQPSASPSGKRIAFVSTRDDVLGDIYTLPIAKPGAANWVRLTSNTRVDNDPAWSPDGSRIAYAERTNAGPEDIFTVTLSTGSKTAVTKTDLAAEHTPAWSPDSKRIAFASDRDGYGCEITDGGSVNFLIFDQLFTASASGGKATRLTNTPSRTYYSPDWHGTKLAFQADTYPGVTANTDPCPASTGDRIFTLPDTGGTPNKRFAGLYPSWAPDGSGLAYNTGLSGPILRSNLDGSSPHTVTNSGAFADWF